MDFFTWQAFDGDDATGINTATISHAADNVWYDLSGRRVAKPTQRGIYIHGGKKVVIR